MQFEKRFPKNDSTSISETRKWNCASLLVASLLILALGTGTGISGVSSAVDSHGYPNDPLFPRQWNLHHTSSLSGARHDDIHVVEAWKLTHCSPDVTIAFLDTGVDAQHSELGQKLVPGVSFLPGESPTVDRNGHGTGVASIAAASTNDGVGMAGVCPLGRVMPVTVADVHGHARMSVVARGLVWAVDHGTRVINVSIGSLIGLSALSDAVNYAYDHGVLVVAAAGNDHEDYARYPAAYPHVLAVGGSDLNDAHWPPSNGGPADLVLAPGEFVLTRGLLHTHWKYGYWTGTSYATAQVSGLAALIVSVRPDLSPQQVIDVIDHAQTSERLLRASKDV